MKNTSCSELRMVQKCKGKLLPKRTCKLAFVPGGQTLLRHIHTNHNYTYVHIRRVHINIHAYMLIHIHTANALSNVLIALTIYDNCATENKHLSWCVSSIVFEHKGQHIIADNFDSNNNDCRLYQYALCH